jgi:hypothetical protein
LVAMSYYPSAKFSSSDYLGRPHCALIFSLLQAAELCAVGSITGATQSLGASALVKVHQIRDPSFQPSLPVPEFCRATGGGAAYMGSIQNMRYQFVSGIDRYDFAARELHFVLH